MRRLVSASCDKITLQFKNVLEAKKKETSHPFRRRAGAQPDRGITGGDFDAKSGAEEGAERSLAAPSDFAETLAHAGLVQRILSVGGSFMRVVIFGHDGEKGIHGRIEKTRAEGQ